MSEETVKLTVRLPVRLHRALKERAAEYNVSLNQAVVNTLAAELVPEPTEETNAASVRRVLKKQDKLADTAWMSELAEELLAGDEIPSLEEVRGWLRGVPLSDWIIEDRGPL